MFTGTGRLNTYFPILESDFLSSSEHNFNIEPSTGLHMCLIQSMGPSASGSKFSWSDSTI